MRTLLGRPAHQDARAAVLMMHGGAENGTDEVTGRSGSFRRAQWMADTIRPRLAREGVDLHLLRFSVRGWNGRRGEPSPVADARWALDTLREQYAGRPLVLLGHSMGARTALRSVGERDVVGLVGLAPWFPADEPIAQVGGKHLVAAHGSRDRITSARQTRRLLARADEVAASTQFVDMGPLGHYMLTHVRRWNRAAVQGVLEVLERAGT